MLNLGGKIQRAFWKHISTSNIKCSVGFIKGCWSTTHTNLGILEPLYVTKRSKLKTYLLAFSELWTATPSVNTQADHSQYMNWAYWKSRDYHNFLCIMVHNCIWKQNDAHICKYKLSCKHTILVNIVFSISIVYTIKWCLGIFNKPPTLRKCRTLSHLTQQH